MTLKNRLNESFEIAKDSFIGSEITGLNIQRGLFNNLTIIQAKFINCNL